MIYRYEPMVVVKVQNTANFYKTFTNMSTTRAGGKEWKKLWVKVTLYRSAHP